MLLQGIKIHDKDGETFSFKYMGSSDVKDVASIINSLIKSRQEQENRGKMLLQKERQEQEELDYVLKQSLQEARINQEQQEYRDPYADQPLAQSMFIQQIQPASQEKSSEFMTQKSLEFYNGFLEQIRTLTIAQDEKLNAWNQEGAFPQLIYEDTFSNYRAANIINTLLFHRRQNADEEDDRNCNEFVRDMLIENQPEDDRRLDKITFKQEDDGNEAFFQQKLSQFLRVHNFEIPPIQNKWK